MDALDGAKVDPFKRKNWLSGKNLSRNQSVDRIS